MIRLLAGALCALVLALPAPAANAALPARLDGQQLPSLAPMLERATPAVVNIATEGRVELRMNPLFNDPFFRRFFDVPDRPRYRRTQSLGSGVIVDAKRGLVLTNTHVIANATEITVNLQDGRALAAELVGADPDTDVAVVRIPAENLTALPLADSDKLRVGDFVVAIGNPFNIGQTVTSGIVSALARTGLNITGYDELIQTDASINPGNSGGALVNLRGELVGLNTAIYSQTGNSVGIGFAIPVNMAQRVMEQLVEHGEVQRGYLGAQLQDMTAELADAFDLPVTQGAVVVNVLEGSPAAQAGLRPGDVITRVNGRTVRTAAHLRNEIGLTRVGDSAELEFLRDGKASKAKVVVTNPETTARRDDDRMRNERLAGITVGEIPPSAPFYGRVEGVVVLNVARNTKAWAAGLREGDVVTSVNRTPVPSVSVFVRVVDGLKGQLLLRVLRGREARFIVIR